MNHDKKDLYLQQKVENVLHFAMQEGKLVSKVDPKRLTSLRVSSFPFCGLRWFLDLPRASSKRSTSDFAKAYFTTVGTCYHTLIQAVLAELHTQDALNTYVVADWLCLGCKKRFFTQRKPLKCSKCGSTDLASAEVEIQDGPIMGHVDLIIGVEEGNNPPLWVVCDFKTSSIKRLTSGNHTSADNKHQLRAYIRLLQKRGLPVSSLGFLIYIAQDNPFSPKLVPVKMSPKRTDANLSFFKEQYHQASTVNSLREVRELVACRPCHESFLPQYAGCRWGSTCAGKDNSSTMVKEASVVFGRLREKLPIHNK